MISEVENMIKEITDKEAISVNGILTSINTLKEETVKNERERMLSIVSRCIAHNIYNVSEGIALLNEIKEEVNREEYK